MYIITDYSNYGIYIYIYTYIMPHEAEMHLQPIRISATDMLILLHRDW